MSCEQARGRCHESLLFRVRKFETSPIRNSDPIGTFRIMCHMVVQEGGGAFGPLSIKLGTHKPVQAIFWPWLESFSVHRPVQSFKVFTRGSAQPLSRVRPGLEVRGLGTAVWGAGIRFSVLRLWHARHARVLLCEVADRGFELRDSRFVFFPSFQILQQGWSRVPRVSSVHRGSSLAL